MSRSTQRLTFRLTADTLQYQCVENCNLYVHIELIFWFQDYRGKNVKLQITMTPFTNILAEMEKLFSPVSANSSNRSNGPDVQTLYRQILLSYCIYTPCHCNKQIRIRIPYVIYTSALNQRVITFNSVTEIFSDTFLLLKTV